MSDDDNPSGVPPDWPAESAQRWSKLQRLRGLGIEPYPNRFSRSHDFT